MKTLDVITTILLVVGGLNWGLWGFFQFDLVAAIFGGNGELLSRVVYGLVGLSALYQAASWKSKQAQWSVAKV